MICATLLFFQPDWPRRLLGMRRPPVPQIPAQSTVLTTGRRIALTVAGLYIAFQFLFPLRYFLYPGNPRTEEGHYFSWHMMLREKFNGVRFIATDPHTGRTGPIEDIERARSVVPSG